MNKQTREAVQALLSQVQDLIELDYWYGAGDDEYQAEEKRTAENATRIVSRYLYEEGARAEVKKYANAEEKKHREQGRTITNRAEWERDILARMMTAYDNTREGN